MATGQISRMDHNDDDDDKTVSLSLVSFPDNPAVTNLQRHRAGHSVTVSGGLDDDAVKGIVDGEKKISKTVGLSVVAA